jgi:hypothetical protein
MFNSLYNSINFAKTFTQYSPLTAGLGQEPAASVGSMIRNSLLNPPMTWYFNRTEFTFNTQTGVQDYTEQVSDLSFVENVSLMDDEGNIWQIKDVYNNAALAKSKFEQRPNAMSVESTSMAASRAPVTLSITNVAVAANVLTVSVTSTTGVQVGDQVSFNSLVTATFLNGQTVILTAINPGVSITAAFTHGNYSNADTGNVVYAGLDSLRQFLFRFLGVPDKIYTVTLVYQKLAPQFGPFFITSCGNASASKTSYVGSFDPLSFPVGATAIITGFVTNAVNNGSFTVVSCTSTLLVLSNSAGIAETASAYANNFSWDPIPNQYSDVYNNLFLSEAMAAVDDARAQLYRQRGIAAFLAKASGLTEMQKNAFIQQWLQRSVERAEVSGGTQQGTAGRDV